MDINTIDPNEIEELCDWIEEEEDPHIGCYSYPFCHYYSNGCALLHDDPEPIGHR